MKNFKRYSSLGIGTFWYKNNGLKYGHDFKEVQIGSNCIYLTDGYNVIKTVYYKPKTSIKTLKAMANELLLKGERYEQ